MSREDRELLDAIRERDRAWPSDYREWPRFVRPDVQPSWDRRELLRIVAELEARNRVLEETLGRTVVDLAADAIREQDARDAAAEAEFLRPIGGGLG